MFWMGLIVTLAVVALHVIGLCGPSDLIDYGQEEPVSYVMDAVKNGHWIVQSDVAGNITSKPPLYTWLAGLVSEVAGGKVNRFTVTLPAFLGTLALGLVILQFGAKHFGQRAGFLAAMCYVLSPVVAKQVTLVRTDGLFSLTVAVAAMLAFAAWQNNGKGWTWFWFAAAAATLAKGPLGIVLAAGGLFAVLWEKRTGHSAPVKGSHWLGVLLFLAIAGGWFALAYSEQGHALTDKLLVRELYNHAVRKAGAKILGLALFMPSFDFLMRFAPWSIFACVAFWRLCRRPSPDDGQRRLERFLFCWFIVGLLLLSIAAHKRPDLIFPLIPAAALLAGRELSRFTTSWPDRRLVFVALCLTVVVSVCAGFQYGKQRLNNDGVKETQAAEELADIIRRQVENKFPLAHLDTSPILQMHLETASPLVSSETASRLLHGEAAAFVAVRNADVALPMLGTNGVYIVAEASRTKRTHMAVLGNRPSLTMDKGETRRTISP